jgi:predicted dehydrogenase
VGKLRIGFIGFGKQATGQHARYLVEQCADTVEIVAICDVLPADLPFVQQQKELLGLHDIPVSTGTSESDLDGSEQVATFLAALPDLDALIISTPDTKHVSQAKVCLEHRRHVLVEKPPALTYAQGKLLADLATGTGRPCLIVGSQRRYEQAYLYARQVIKSGELGEVVSIDSIVSRSWDLVQGWRADPARGGGVLWDYAWHSIDTILFLIERKPLSVDATLSCMGNGPLGTHASVLIRFEGNLAVTLTANLGAPRHAVYERLQIWGTRGMLLLERCKPVYDNQPPVIIHQLHDGRVLQPRVLAQSWGATEAFVRLLLALRDAQPEQAVARVSVHSTIAESLETLRIIDAISASARSGCRSDCLAQAGG